jgi:SAM-dependent methyltransferase
LFKKFAGDYPKILAGMKINMTPIGFVIMPHIFNPTNKHMLESDARKKIQPPYPLVKFISEIPNKMRRIAVDVGAGTGYFTVHLAKLFKKVYAVEVSFEMGEYLIKRAHGSGLMNIGVIISDKPPELDFDVDFVLFGNVLHEMSNPQQYIRWASKSRIVAVIDWKKVETPFGPPLDDRIPEEDVIFMLEKERLKVKEIRAYKYHYFVVGYR